MQTQRIFGVLVAIYQPLRFCGLEKETLDECSKGDERWGELRRMLRALFNLRAKSSPFDDVREVSGSDSIFTDFNDCLVRERNFNTDNVLVM